jgi:hypothetical protein
MYSWLLESICACALKTSTLELKSSPLKILFDQGFLT